MSSIFLRRLRSCPRVRRQKCLADDVDGFFPPLIVSEAERQWETSLADLVRPLPAFDDVIVD